MRQRSGAAPEVKSGLGVHIFPTNLKYGSRIERITRYLKARGLFCNIEMAGITDGSLPVTEEQADGRIIRRFKVNVKLRNGSRVGRVSDFLVWSVRVFMYYLPREVSCVNAHTLSTLPVSWLISLVKGSFLIYEPHELETETSHSRGLSKYLLRGVESLLIRRATSVVVVAPGISQWYEKKYKLKNIYTVRNIPEFRPASELPRNYFSEKYGFGSDDLVFIYQGLLSEGRGLRVLIQVFSTLPSDRHVVFLGFGPLRDQIRLAAKEYSNIHYHDAVPVDELLTYTMAASVGLMMIEPVSLSYKLCYPNKYCEYLSAKIPVIITDDLWLKSEVEGYACGWALPLSSKAIAEAIGKIGPADILEKAAGAEMWRTNNNWDRELATVDEVYKQLK